MTEKYKDPDWRIWKFPLQVTDVQEIDISHGSKFLSVQLQNGIPNLWALCPTGYTKVKRRIYAFGTGNLINLQDVGSFIGTYQTQGGQFVWHVFADRDLNDPWNQPGFGFNN
jgi:hypothetical protein